MTHEVMTQILDSSEQLEQLSPAMQRAYEVEQAIDPMRTLPEVEVVVDPSKPTTRGKFRPVEHLITHDGIAIGKCVVVTDYATQERWLNGVEVNGDLRGQGYGMAAYKEAIVQTMMDGLTFRTHDWSQTASAKKVWEVLAKKGLAQVEEEFTPDGHGRFNGKYSIRP